MSDQPPYAREWRKSEISRQMDQINGMLTAMREAGAGDEMTLQLTAGIAGFAQMVAGMADDMSRIRELLQLQVEHPVQVVVTSPLPGAV